MSLNEFNILMEEIFTNNIYNLLLLHGFDIPILEDQKFGSAYTPYETIINEIASTLFVHAYGIGINARYNQKAKRFEINLFIIDKTISILYTSILDPKWIRDKAIPEIGKYLNEYESKRFRNTY